MSAVFTPAEFPDYCVRMSEDTYGQAQVGFMEDDGSILWFDNTWSREEAERVQGSYLADSAVAFFKAQDKVAERYGTEVDERTERTLRKYSFNPLCEGMKSLIEPDPSLEGSVEDVFGYEESNEWEKNSWGDLTSYPVVDIYFTNLLGQNCVYSYADSLVGILKELATMEREV